MTSVFLIKFILSFLKIIVPFLLEWIKIKVYDQTKKQMIEYQWKNVDIIIEKESIKGTYETTLQVDGTVFDFLDVIIEFAFIAFFSISFPLTSLIGFVSGVLSIHMDKYWLMHYFKRPIPINTANIGIW